MPRAVVLRFLGIVSVLLVLSGGGYACWTLYVRHTQTVQQLAATQAALTKRQETLTLLEEEQRKLSKAYETLKGRWTSSEAELQRATKASEQMTKELDSLTSERARLQSQLGDAKAQTSQLQQQANALEQTRAALVEDTNGLNTTLRAAVTTSRAQVQRVERLQRALSEQESQEQQLHDRMVELSHAYEQLAKERVAGAAPLGSQPATGHSVSSAAGEPPPVASLVADEGLHGQDFSSDASPQVAMPPSTINQMGQFLKDLWPGASAQGGPEGRRLARAYRQTGEAFANVQEYQKAAQALERSLTCRDDPVVHQELALLYSQHLHDPGLAARHAQVSTHRPSAQPSSSNDLPRKSWRLVLDWLLQR